MPAARLILLKAALLINIIIIIIIRDWMATNRLKMNEDKTRVIWLGTRYQLCKVTAQTLTLTLPKATVQFSTVVNDGGVLIDSELTVANHIAALSRSCFFHTRQLRSIRHLTSEEMLLIGLLIQAFVSSRLDYCNSVLARWCK